MQNPNQLDRIEDRLEKLDDTIDAQGNRLTAIEADLKHHMARSAALETIVKQHEKYFWFAMGAISLAGPLVTQILKLIFKG
jgi:hypothetical protein